MVHRAVRVLTHMVEFQAVALLEGVAVAYGLVAVVAQVIMVARVVVRTISITLVAVEVDPPIRMD